MNTSVESRRWVLAALMLTMILAAMDATIISTVVPQIVADLGGFSSFTWVFSIYLMVQAILIPIYGKLADQYGRKPILVIGVGIFVLGSTACAAAWNMPSLIAFRALQGVGAGAIMATVNTLAGDLFSIEERARIQGWLSSVWAFAAITGPAFGGLMVEQASWRWIFFINLPLGAISLFFILFFLHEKVEKRPHQIDYLGGLFIMLTLSTLIFTLMQGGKSWPWFSWQVCTLLALSAALALLTLRIEARAQEPIVPSWLWRYRAFSGSNMAMIAMGALMMAPMAYLPTFVQSVHGLGVMAAGFVLAVMSLGWPLASSFSGRLYLTIGFRNTALIGACLQASAALLFLCLPQDAAIAWLVFDQFLFGLGFGLMSTPLLVGAQSVVDWSTRGVVTSANMFSRYLGQALGAAVFGAIFNTSLARQLELAPAWIKAQGVGELNQVVASLHSGELSEGARVFLQEALFSATHGIYWGVLLFTGLTFASAALTPKVYRAIDFSAKH